MRSRMVPARAKGDILEGEFVALYSVAPGVGLVVCKATTTKPPIGVMHWPARRSRNGAVVTLGIAYARKGAEIDFAIGDWIGSDSNGRVRGVRAEMGEEDEAGIVAIFLEDLDAEFYRVALHENRLAWSVPK